MRTQAGGWGLIRKTPVPPHRIGVLPAVPQRRSSFDIRHQDRSHRRRAYKEPGHAHELTFSCDRRYRFLAAGPRSDSSGSPASGTIAISPSRRPCRRCGTTSPSTPSAAGWSREQRMGSGPARDGSRAPQPQTSFPTGFPPSEHRQFDSPHHPVTHRGLEDETPATHRFGGSSVGRGFRDDLAESVWKRGSPFLKGQGQSRSRARDGWLHARIAEIARHSI